ncbi:hypothetical protein CFOL_v3_01024 [Cephalotus follicularis]|uniref:Uncharacterized protein n=1 Tax=Cephalotus follicularis TaxID=3775 RepID=A0A1Q3AP06_CEPFO|nr:hypothetical protein CFOL_v3_01024 [Cephalotus follicularis]
MGVDAISSGVKLRRFVIISMRSCYRSLCNHPFLVAMVSFLIFMYRWFPFMFSLLVSASPVLVCTAILLGTLLSFGQPNLPEIDEEEKVTHEIVSLKTGVMDDTTIVERDESFPVESYIGKKRDIVVENSGEGASMMENRAREVGEYGGSVEYKPLIDGSSQEAQFEKRVIDEIKKEPKWEKKREINEETLGVEGVLSDREVVENLYSFAGKGGDQNLEVQDDNLPGGSIGVHKGHFSPTSSWKRGGEDGGDAEESDQSSESGSDGAESSSPDASMADIIPMLDELHPLLDLDAPQPAHMPQDGSDAGSEKSHESNDSSIESESEEDIEKHAEDEEEDEEEEEVEVEGGKEDGSKSAITWTEADQKNLMDLGSLELERNQRLESLIARRRARKSMKVMAEKNLIDLDGVDLPFNVPAISTRQNPFDLPYDSYHDLPIPGSAPSILLPGRNPFDLPYDSSEEKPDLKGETLQQEFTVFQQREAHQREAFFRRHESFSVGSSSLGGLKRDRHDFLFKPYFVPEGVASEGTSYPTFQRQLSEVSDSKATSVPDTESVSSAADDEDKKLNEEDDSRETEFTSNIDHASECVECGSQSSDIDSLDTELAEKRDFHLDEDEIILGDVESLHDLASSLSATGLAAPVELNTRLLHPDMEPDDEVCSSKSSLSSLSDIDDRISDVRKEEETLSLELRRDHIEKTDISAQASFAESDFQFTSEVVDDNQHREPVYDSSPPADEKHLSFSSISSDTQGEMPEMVSAPLLVESAYKESEVHDEIIEMDALNIEKMRVSSSLLHEANENQLRSLEVNEVSKQDATRVEPSYEPNYDNQNTSMVPEFVVEHNSVDSGSSGSDTQSLEEGVTNKEEIITKKMDEVHPLIHDTDSEVCQDQGVTENLDSLASSSQMACEESTPSAPEEQQPSMVVDHALRELDVCSSETEPVEEHATPIEEICQLQPEVDQVHSSNFDPKISYGDTMVPGHQHIPSDDLVLSEPDEQQLALVSEKVSEVHPNLPFREPEHVEEHLPSKDDALQFEQYQVLSSSSGAKVDAGVHLDMDVKVASSGSRQLDGPSKDKMASELDKRQSMSDKSIVEPTFDDIHETQEPCDLLESKNEVSITSNVNGPEFHVAGDTTSTNLSFVTSDSVPLPSESPEYESPTGEEDMRESILDKVVCEDHGQASEQFNNSAEAYGFHSTEQNLNQEADEVKEIDEGLLSELDSVGDFSVKEVAGESLHTDLIPENISERSESVLLAEESNLTETNLELPVLEVRSIEDIELDVKQFHEEVDDEDTSLPSMIKDQSRVPMETNLGIPVVEARTLEDINVALKQVSEGNPAEQAKLVESKDGSSEVGANAVISATYIESRNVKSGVQENSMTAYDKSKQDT